MIKEKIRDGIGYAKIVPSRPLTVGSRNTFILTYYVGKKGIKNGGSIRITIPHTFTTPQIEEFIKDGFTTAKCSRENIFLSLHIESRIFCAYRPELSHSGAFGKSLFIKINNGDLNEGDFIEVTYGNVSYYGKESWGPKRPKASCVSGKHEFTLAVDLNGEKEAPVTGYYLLKNSPVVKTIPGKLHELIPIAPSNIEFGQKIPIYIVFVDRYFNPIKYEKIDFELKSKSEAKKFYSNNGTICFNPMLENKKDMSFIVGTISKENFFAKTNPIKLKKTTNGDNLYWGDIHAHTSYSDGMGLPDEAISFARDVARLDFCSITDHDDIGPYLSDEEWHDIKKIIAKFNEPNKFTTFLGYEYRSALGDMNVYYPGDDGILMCGKKEKWNSPSKLIPVISKKRGMIIPHMHFGADWSGYDPKIYRVMEIYSQHGSAEYIGCPRQIPFLNNQLQKGNEGNKNTTFQEILSLGMKIGVTAGSDSHSGRPGLSNWLRVTLTYRGGLTAVFAKENTRELIWKALYERHCYGTTGSRIYVEFCINGFPMGSEIKAKNREIYINIIGTAPLEHIVVIKNNHPFFQDKTANLYYSCILNDAFSADEDFYYLRVYQEDGEMAWSSPIWVTY